jgi:outer membrane protein assembly factor BamB
MVMSFGVACLVASPASSLKAQESNLRIAVSHSAQEWREAWRLDVSRGASAELVWADSTLIVASLDRNVHIVAPRSEPTVIWKKNFKGGFEAKPIVDEDRIYLAETLKGGRLVAVDRHTRMILWTASAGDMVAAPVVTADRIYTVSSIGVVKAFNHSGLEMWSTELETRVVATPVLLTDRLVIAASDGTLYSLDSTGGEVAESVDAEAGLIWGQPVVRSSGVDQTVLYATLGGQVIEVAADLTIVQRRSFPSRFYTGPEAAGDRLYLIGHEGTLWAYDWSTAEIAWQRELEGTFRAAPRVGAAFVSVGNLSKTLYLIDSGSGEVIWSTDVDGAITSRPLIHNNDLYVMTERGTVFAFQPVGSSP